MIQSELQCFTQVQCMLKGFSSKTMWHIIPRLLVGTVFLHIHEYMYVCASQNMQYVFFKYIYIYIEYNLTKSQQHVQVQNWKLFYQFDFCLGLFFLSGIQHYVLYWPFAKRMRLIFSSCSATRELWEPRSMQI